jgi:putative ribosome biogenesis GTPase RsgA
MQAATFGTTGAAQAQVQLERLKQQEVSQFSGSSGAGKGSLMGTEAGLS